MEIGGSTFCATIYLKRRFFFEKNFVLLWGQKKNTSRQKRCNGIAIQIISCEIRQDALASHV